MTYMIHELKNMKSKKTNISDTPNLKYSINWALLKCKDILYQLKTSIFSKKKKPAKVNSFDELFLYRIMQWIGGDFKRKWKLWMQS